MINFDLSLKYYILPYGTNIGGKPLNLYRFSPSQNSKFQATMTKRQYDKPVCVIGYCHLEFICILVLVCWYLALFEAGGQALKSVTETSTAALQCYAPRLERSSSGRQWITPFICDETLRMRNENIRLPI